MPSSCITLSGTNLPPRQCSPLQFSLHFLGIPSETKYLGVKRACMLPSLASQPLGMSTESTFSSKPLNYSRKSRQGCRISPEKGKPKTASIIRLRCCKCSLKAARPCSGWKEAGTRAGTPLRAQRLRQFPFLPSSWRNTTRSTAQCIMLRCLAATSPSPPLLPGPTSTHTLCFCQAEWLERMRCATWATANPASSMSVSDAKWYFSMSVSSSSLLSSLLPNVTPFIRYFIKLNQELYQAARMLRLGKDRGLFEGWRIMASVILGQQLGDTIKIIFDGSSQT